MTHYEQGVSIDEARTVGKDVELVGERIKEYHEGSKGIKRCRSNSGGHKSNKSVAGDKTILTVANQCENPGGADSDKEVGYSKELLQRELWTTWEGCESDRGI